MLTTTEAAKLIGVDSKTLVRWANKDKIKCHKTLGGHRRFKFEDVMNAIYGPNFGVEDGKSSTVAS